MKAIEKAVSDLEAVFESYHQSISAAFIEFQRNGGAIFDKLHAGGYTDDPVSAPLSGAGDPPSAGGAGDPPSAGGAVGGVEPPPAVPAKPLEFEQPETEDRRFARTDP